MGGCRTSYSTVIAETYLQIAHVVGNKTMATKNDVMAKEDRARMILEFMADTGVAMPPGLWYENLDLYKNITFSYDTVRRRLHDFQEVGWAERHDRDQGIYGITDAGRRAAENGVDDSRLAEVIGTAGE